MLPFAKSHGALPPTPPNLLSTPQLVQGIVDLSTGARTDLEWHDNDGFIRAYKARLFSDKISETARCESLSALQDPQLINFYDDILEANSTTLAKCSKNLASRVNSYLAIRSLDLAASYKKIAKQILSPCSNKKSITFGPQEDHFSDVDQSPVLFGNDYPKCAITLTFDDGPHSILTPKLLDILAQQRLQVNFFVVGDRVKTSPAILKSAFEQGHLIGNHTQSHADLRKLSFENAVAEIESGFDRIREVTGFYLPFFRFPFGASNSKLRSYLKHFSRVEFYWNIDTRDWAIKDPEALFKHSLEEIEKVQRGIALYHDIQPQTIEIMPFLLETLKDNGYTPFIVRPNEVK